MKETIIQEQLDNLFPNSDLEFQVVYQVPYLKVAINYYSTLPFDRATLRHGIQRTLSKLALPDDVEYLALYTRPINQTEPDWSTCVRLSVAKNSQDANRDEPSASQNHDTSEQEEEITARETESSSEEPIAREQSQDNHSSETAEQETSPNKQLRDYCFIRNRSLLNEEIVAPPLPVAELVTSFHELSVSEKQQLLPIMSQLLEQKTPAGIEEVSAQQWIEELLALNQEQLRKAKIWLSRYCYDPDTTIARLENAINQSEEPAVQEETENPPIAKPSKFKGTKYDVEQPTNIKVNQTNNQFILIRKWRNLDSYNWIFSTFVAWLILFILIGKEVPIILILILIPVMSVITYFAIAKWVNKTYILINRNKLMIRHKPIPWFRDKKQIRIDNLKLLFFEEKETTEEITEEELEENNESKPVYEVYADTYTGAEEKLVVVYNREEALFIIKTVEDYLGL